MPTRDAGSPARYGDTETTTVQTFTSPSFNVAAGEVIYLHLLGNPNSSSQTPTFGTPTGGSGLSWAQMGSINNASGGAVVVWWAYSAAAQTGITITATITWSGAAAGPSPSVDGWLDLWSGADPLQGSAASATSTSTTQTNNPSVTTTRTGSRVAGLMMDWAATGAPTSSDTIDAYTIAGQSSGGRAFKSSDSGAAGSVSLNFVAGGASPINSFVAYEILAAVSTGGGFVAQPGLSMRSGSGALLMQRVLGSTPPSVDPGITPVTTINANQGTWTWAGSTQATTQLINQTTGAWTWAGSTQATTQLINATPGTWTWAGSTSSVDPQQVNQTTGTWTWAGSTQQITAPVQTVNATPGAWNWAGSTQATTQLINQSTGTWTWTGSTAAFTQLVNATPGTWTWAGSQQATTQLINANQGTWTWAGSNQQITTPGGAATINANVGAWSWAGSTQSLDAQQISQSVGAFNWAGSTASIDPQQIGATPGLWSWVGSQAQLISQITIDSTPGLWSWVGSQATIGTGAVSFDYHDGGKEKKRRKRDEQRIQEQREAREKLRAQLTELVDPKPVAEMVEAKAEQVFKEPENPVILAPEDDDEEDIISLLLSYYEIPRGILPRR